MALEDLYQTIVARAIQVARANTIMPRLVSKDIAASLEIKGGTVNVPVIDTPRTASSITPGPVPPASSRPAPRNVPVTLDFWEDATFSLSDKEITSMENSNDYIPKELEASAAGLGRSVDLSIFNLYPDVYGFAGAPGVVPFSVSTYEAQQARTILSSQNCIKGMGSQRHMVLDEFSYGNAIGLETLQRVDASGSNLTLREAEIGRALGFWWHEDQLVPRHVNPNGTPTGYLVNGAVAASADAFTGTVTIDTGANAPVRGDIFTVAGDSQTYTVVAIAGSVVTFSPGPQQAWADNAAMTFKGAHYVNLAFDSNAIAFASRAASDPVPSNVPIFRWLDEVTGIVFVLEVDRQHYQTAYKLSAMWGCKLVQPRFITRIAG